MTIRNQPWSTCPPDDLKHCHWKTAFLYVHPNDYKPDGDRTAQEAWVRVPGKHRNKEAGLERIARHHQCAGPPGHLHGHT